ncbi:recombinase family protein [Brevibacillus ginsengisoli]|uniref:recombinase family protein n=1 Tax=Brevibacillus ginsengisoli TaxID=363854 RepID=UPI003CE822DA
MRIASYIRVSTDEQAEKGNSLTEQKERQIAYCIAMGWGNPEFFIDDGYSAKNLNRPAIQQLINRVKENEFDLVLTTKLDRFCRKLLDLLQVIDLFTQHNCSFVSASESFDTSTAVGRMTLQLLGTFAEFERERISERVKDNMMSLAKNTDKVLAIPCYGYDIVDGKYSIIDYEAANIRFMFELAEQGHGHRMIAKELNDRGITTKRGKLWDQVNVKRLINTETIAGIMVYNKRKTQSGKTVMRDKSEWIIKENNHPYIIPPEQFYKVQSIMQSRSRANKHAESESYLLTGLVKCGHCGKNMKGQTSRYNRANKSYTYYRYICSSYVLGYGCKSHTVHRDQLENFIIDEIKDLVNTSTKKLHIKVAAPAAQGDEIQEIHSQLSKIDKRMQKQIEAYENDLISADDLKLARNRIDADRQRLREKLQKLESKSGDPKAVKINATKLLDDITGVDRIKAKAAIRQIVDRIDIENGEVIDLTWKP